MPSRFTDATGNGYHLNILTPADWTISTGGMPNGDNYATGDGSISLTYNLNGDDFHLNDGTAWTVEMWIYFASTPGSTMVPMAMGIDGTTVAWQSVITSGGVELSIINTGSTAYLTAHSGTLSTAAWHHLVWIKQTTASLALYKDNALYVTASTPSGTARTPTTAYKLAVGTDANAGNDLTSIIRIAKIAIYNAALTTGEINTHYLTMA